MPEFQLDTSGDLVIQLNAWTPPVRYRWRDFDAFTQGYIEAMFFTEYAPGVTTEEWQATDEHDEGSIPEDVAFCDLAPKTLMQIILDCESFQGTDAWRATDATDEAADATPSDRTGGMDFWYTRNGHGCGFWDGDWPEPFGSALTEAAKTFGEVSVYLGDDGKVYAD